MNKKNVVCLFGGNSSEYDVSLKSAYNVVGLIDKDKYDVFLIGITRDGDFYLYSGDVSEIESDNWFKQEFVRKVTFSCNRSDKGFIIYDSGELISVDIIFPILHGLNGEDGRLQGLFELAGLKYVGCDQVSSMICMDKYLSHKLVSLEGICCPKSYRFDRKCSYEDICRSIGDLKFPLFVKPVKSGSSFGVNKVNSLDDLKMAIDVAREYDHFILVEEGVVGREIGCAILGNDELIIGELDEINIDDGFYDYDVKYNLESRVVIPARLDKVESDSIKEVAKLIYKTLGCKGLARVDVFYTDDKKIVFNEINTMPGCTSHSGYPLMLKEVGLEFSEVIDKLLEMALK